MFCRWPVVVVYSRPKVVALLSPRICLSVSLFLCFCVSRVCLSVSVSVSMRQFSSLSLVSVFMPHCHCLCLLSFLESSTSRSLPYAHTLRLVHACERGCARTYTHSLSLPDGQVDQWNKRALDVKPREEFVCVRIQQRVLTGYT